MKYNYILNKSPAIDEFRNLKKYNHQVTTIILFMPLSFVFWVVKLLFIPPFTLSFLIEKHCLTALDNYFCYLSGL